MSEIPLPLYYKIQQDLIKKIENNEFETNCKIPSERKLMKKYDVSRTTIRKAVNNLVNDGYCYRVHGKGTFVQEREFTNGLIELTSCSQDIIKRGKKPSSKVINFKKENPTKKISSKLNIKDNSQVILLERVRYADKEPINITKSFLPFDLFPEIMENDFSNMSLYNFLEENYGVEIIEALRTIDVSETDEVYSKLLEIEKGTPILFFTGLVKGRINGEIVPIEYFRSHFKSTKYKFYIKQGSNT